MDKTIKIMLLIVCMFILASASTFAGITTLSGTYHTKVDKDELEYAFDTITEKQKIGEIEVAFCKKDLGKYRQQYPTTGKSDWLAAGGNSDCSILGTFAGEIKVTDKDSATKTVVINKGTSQAHFFPSTRRFKIFADDMIVYRYPASFNRYGKNKRYIKIVAMNNVKYERNGVVLLCDKCKIVLDPTLNRIDIYRDKAKVMSKATYKKVKANLATKKGEVVEVKNLKNVDFPKDQKYDLGHGKRDTYVKLEATSNYGTAQLGPMKLSRIRKLTFGVIPPQSSYKNYPLYALEGGFTIKDMPKILLIAEPKSYSALKQNGKNFIKFYAGSLFVIDNTGISSQCPTFLITYNCLVLKESTTGLYAFKELIINSALNFKVTSPLSRKQKILPLMMEILSDKRLIKELNVAQLYIPKSFVQLNKEFVSGITTHSVGINIVPGDVRIPKYKITRKPKDRVITWYDFDTDLKARAVVGGISRLVFLNLYTSNFYHKFLSVSGYKTIYPPRSVKPFP